MIQGQEISTRRRVSVALTCVGGRYVADIVDALRRAPDFEIRIVGLDASPKAMGRMIVDDFAVVPLPGESDDAYLKALLRIIRQYEIDVVLQGSEGETRILSAHRASIIEAGARLALSDPESVAVMTDKLELFGTLSKKGVDVGPFHAVDSERDFRRSAELLGYPQRKIVFKPRKGAGSRGVMIADPVERTYRPLLENRFCGTGDLESLIAAMRIFDQDCGSLLAMPWYGPSVFDVDCLANKGRATVTVPRLREYENPLSPFSEGCRIDLRPTVLEFVSKICKAMELDGLCDFDIAMEDDCIPRLIDASCRLSGSVGATVAAGVNLPAMAVSHALGLTPTCGALRQGTVVRPFPRLTVVSSSS